MATQTPRKIERKSKLGPIIAVVVLVLVMGGGVIFLLSPASDLSTETDSSAKKETAKTSAKTSTATTKDEPIISEEEGPYKGWQKYENKAWHIFVRYPAGWTLSETAGNLNAAFLGPAMAAGGVILNECVFSVFAEEAPAGTQLEAYIAAAKNAPMGGGTVSSTIETSIDSNPAIKIVDTYVDTGQPWKRTRIWTIKSGRVYTLTYAASINYNKVDYYTKHDTEAEMIVASVLLK